MVKQSPTRHGESRSQVSAMDSADSTEEAKVILICPKCGAKNRLPASRRLEAVCGRCHAALSPGGEPVQSTGHTGTGELDEIVLRSRVRGLRAQGRSQREIALELGVTVAMVDKLVREIQAEDQHTA